MPDRLESPNIFQSASLICLGANLENTHRTHGSTFFVLSGENLLADRVQYERGRLRVDPRRLEKEVNHLRDLIFQGRNQRQAS